MLTLTTKNYGTQKIESIDDVTTGGTFFKAVEHLFNNWFTKNTQAGAPMAKDIEGMYYGECGQPAICSKKGAILQAIENVIELCEESGLTRITSRDLEQMDIECAFE